VITEKDYQEVHLPAVVPKIPPNETLVPISDLPEWAQPAFKGMESLNRVQSKVGSVCEVSVVCMYIHGNVTVHI
jgi:hypothetical protein